MLLFVRYNQARCDGVKASRVYDAVDSAAAMRSARKSNSSAEIVVAKASQRSYGEITSFHFPLLFRSIVIVWRRRSSWSMSSTASAFDGFW
jgi:hypothetical protein